MTDAQNKPIVAVENLRISARVQSGVRNIVSGISFKILAGECVGLVGESGSGKSVTSRSLLGLNDSNLDVSADRLEILGEDYRGASEKQWRRLRGLRVGYVLQDALGSLDPLKRIHAEVRETLDTHGIGSRKMRGEQVLSTLERVGFPEPAMRARQRSFELSGGLRQRALIASSIVAAPDLLIADEPTTALDVTVQAKILELLAELKQSGMAMLLVSHDLGVVSQLAERIVVMRRGEVVESGSTRDVLSNPRHDYTKMLLAAMPVNATPGTRLSKQNNEKREPAIVRTASQRAERADINAIPDIVLSVKNVSKNYVFPDGNHKPVVKDVTFSLKKGSVLGLVGGSGSGKSTVARLCMGLSRPDAGEVRLFGRNWSDVAEKERTIHRPDIQLISQDPLGAFDPRFDVWQLLSEALAVGGLREKAAQKSRAIELLDAVGLASSVFFSQPARLSGGQRQRIAIARALATQPRILVCDEPVSALDVSVQAQVLDLLNELQRELGLSMLFISHDLSVVRYFCHDMLVMQNGEIVERGETEQLFCTPRHPYTQALISSIPRLPSQISFQSKQDGKAEIFAAAQ
ncbi:ABC transporter ATP-binding protein [Ochrobactrum sp. Q0168]|uniref:dipeptide ABC transporter ATP-binding protein n=1 Tax=Ochrobactrum sp. Q0168 TaxID=2793241 RepID=UPI0018EB77C2|nr:ABC transporter ATP-binding protein [Ochrobactrum sp. Q0168]